MNAAQVERLAKLHELRSAGALNDEEFEAAKRALLRRRRWPLFAGLSACLTGFAAALGWWSAQRPATESSPPAPNATIASRPSRPPEPASPALRPAERLTTAFRAATGRSGRFTEIVEGQRFTVSPIELVDLSFGPVLLVRREMEDGCHACTGFIGIHYLQENDGRLTLARSFPEAVSGWGWGAPPTKWRLTDGFTSNPAIYAEGGYMGQGYASSGATVTELGPAGPVTSDMIHIGSSNAGAITEESGERLCEVEGTIANIVRDRSFDVVLRSGSAVWRVRYVKQGGRFVAPEGADRQSPC